MNIEHRREEKRSSAEAERRLNPKLPESAAAGSGVLRERAAAGIDRAEESGGPAGGSVAGF